MTIGFRDDRRAQYGPIIELNDHNPRIPEPRRVERLDHLKLLHFQFVLFSRMLAKQRWYRARELVELGIDQTERINFGYRITRDERQMRLSPIDPEWVAGWRDLGIDLEHFEEEPLYWYDVEVLRLFREKGPAYFAALDLWEVDWEQKRRLASAQGYEDIPEDPISDPRTWEQKLYHAYLARFQRNPFWRDPGDILRLADLGLRKLAKGIGLRRAHLERLGLLAADRQPSPKEEA
uniref:Uncharacterized protein n=1 Tax=Desulfobacca acetoxidans TaxID=60893 RepID=A0A7C3Z1V0_9BACT